MPDDVTVHRVPLGPGSAGWVLNGDQAILVADPSLSDAQVAYLVQTAEMGLHPPLAAAPLTLMPLTLMPLPRPAADVAGSRAHDVTPAP